MSLGLPQRKWSPLLISVWVSPSGEGRPCNTLYTHRVHNVLQGAKGITLVMQQARARARQIDSQPTRTECLPHYVSGHLGRILGKVLLLYVGFRSLEWVDHDFEGV